jgi:hypothetical protein
MVGCSSWAPPEEPPTFLHSDRALGRHLLAAASVGPPRLDELGLTVVPHRTATKPQQRATVDATVCQELRAPSPDAVTMTNLSARTGTAVLGQVVNGGMVDRVVTQTTGLPLGKAVVVHTEPLSARWWDEGPPKLGGSLRPPLVALLMLASGGPAGLRAIARTALWEACGHPRRGHAAAGGNGWVLLDGPTLLAAHLTAPFPPAARAAASDQSGTRLLHGALAQMRWDAPLREAVHLHAGLVELSLVRESARLPWRILRRSAVP